MLHRFAMLIVPIAIAAAAACRDSDSSQRDAGAETSTGFRCLGHRADGSCVSMPANCPVTIPHDNTPRCPFDYSLIQAKDDTCQTKLICTD